MSLWWFGKRSGSGRALYSNGGALCAAYVLVMILGVAAATLFMHFKPAGPPMGTPDDDHRSLSDPAR